MEGPLSKWTNVMKGWQYRWFVLDDNAGLLSYYTSKDKMVRGARRGCVRLKGAVVGIDDEDDSTFTVTVDGKMFHFQARDGEERERWLRALENTTRRHTSSSSFGYKWSSPLHPPTLQDFDRKLTESDAYLQLLIEQIKDLETKMENAEDVAEKNNLKRVLDKANAVLEMIKHSIVLLQIAKNTTNPVNGVYQPFGDTPVLNDLPDNLEGLKLNDNERLLGNETKSEEVYRNNSSPLMPTHDSTSHNPGGIHNLQTYVVSSIPGPTSDSLIIPETSYSSSDDDDFFDANDDISGSAQSPNNSRLIEKAIEVLQDETIHRNLPNDSGAIDYDALYENEQEEDLGSVEGQGSVISHLLAQVKIGMDLTKVVLPTFILERRSLLEMYADFFAHPDIFISIPDFEEPKDRMVQVVRWYLSAFHAGRKSSVAKKPYNPILGEVFKCYWNIDNTEPTINPDLENPVKEGPVPWAGENNLTFIAEQVSHHPPISAFYAEHFNKKISATAFIWTKSKFLGLSIGVHNIGQGIVSVLEYDEEYIITFPNGYGRSILTVPWIELGGAVSITCAKTGYYTNIEFITKPFYGGKKHRINAEIFQPCEKKPYLSITGEWNGVMHAKSPNGQTEVFIDTKSIPIIKKVVKPISEQQAFESRRMWKEVTAALHYRHVKAATENKFILEQKQRDEARDRKENNSTWANRMFQKVGDNWVYDSPLSSRLKEAGHTITPASSS